MAYLHIPNLYKFPDILMFKELYALEKIHGTSAHVAWRDGRVWCQSGNSGRERFTALFDEAAMASAFRALGHESVIVFGEAYGGKVQAMSHTYGKDLRFIAFEVKIGEHWLSVPNAEQVTGHLGLDFVYYAKIPATIEDLDRERDAPSVQAVRNGMGSGRKREGIVLRPLIELRANSGERMIAKYKRPDFDEVRTPRKVADREGIKVLEDARSVADEWVTPMRLTHVLDKLPEALEISATRTVIMAMMEDVRREGEGEIVWSKEAQKAIGAKTAKLFAAHLKQLPKRQ